MLQIHVRSAVAGVLAVVLVVLALGAAQIRVNPPPAAINHSSTCPQSSWPPHPEDIVNSTFEASGIPPGGSVEVYRVPMNRWFVLVDCMTNYQADFELVEDLGGETRVILDREAIHYNHDGSAGRMSSLGYVFRPGSSVVLRNRDTSTRGVSFHAFAGYLVDA